MAWQYAGAADLEPGSARAVSLTDSGGSEHLVAVICDQVGQWYAIDDTCTHADVPLSEGDIGEGCVECWAHSAEFDLETGEGTLPAPKPVKTYPLQLENGNVLIDVDA
ncbi:MAG: Rieske 2Fe-2S domain-containing protein [Actinomycetaceae bacterium]|nr:Rieske 2Fe-2S domain-containing protein [Actinomycetaceae bacterium]